ncbi:hypothetical protein EGY23_13390 [Pseudomonas aeruginosa]|nr:hypothetical protein EGY23_13390 [Pseudomonas aeruginosa]
MRTKKGFLDGQVGLLPSIWSRREPRECVILDLLKVGANLPVLAPIVTELNEILRPASKIEGMSSVNGRQQCLWG